MISLLRGHAFSITFVVVVFVYFLGFSDNNASLYRLSGLTMGTSFQIQLGAMPTDTDEATIAQEVEALLYSMDKELFSTYSETSELSKLNRHPTNSPFLASKHLFNVIQMASTVSEKSGGAFDVTIGPLVNLWGFGPMINPNDDVPAEAQILERKSQIGFRNINLNAETMEITKLSDVSIDLSAIAKGYAVDQLALYFDAMNVDSYFLEVGGELKIKGLKPGGTSWVPAIEAPVDSASQIYTVFFNRGEAIAVAGSGDYRNYFEKDGVRYSHEIDPRTGYPVNHNLAATYVIDDSVALADAYATAYMILGFDASKQLAQTMGQAVYFIVKQGDSFEGFATAEFERFLEN